MWELNLPWIKFKYLRAYCPALNPAEHVWSTTKYGRLANWPDVKALHHQSHNQLLLRNHFRWAGLETNALPSSRNSQ